MSQQPHVAFISRQRLIGRTNGSSAYLLDLASAVDQAGLNCSLVQPSPSIFGRMPVLRLRSEMRVFSCHRVRGSIRLGHYLVALSPSVWTSAIHGVLAKLAKRAGLDLAWLQDRKAPYSIAMPWTSADKSYVAGNIPDGSIVIADYIFQTEAFAAAGSKASATAIIMHDLFHRRAELVAATKVIDSVATVSEDDEIKMLGRADLVIAIQKAEADYVLSSLPGQAVITVPISFLAVDEPQPGQANEFLFVGSNTEPNVVGLKWFYENCWMKILDAVPNATLSVAGSVSMGMAGQPVPPSVKYFGIVDDLTSIYSRAGVVISPLTFGSGLKIKLIEAMSLGKAIVATSVTLQGVEGLAEKAVLKADDPDDFVAAVIGFARNDVLRLKFGSEALAAAKAHFSAAIAQGSLAEWLAKRSAGQKG